MDGWPTAAQLADELVACRRRGLAYLHVSVGGHPPLPLPGLGRISTLYAAQKRLLLSDRNAYVARLLRDALEMFMQSEPTAGKLISELFFGADAGLVAVASPRDLLESAARRRGARNDLSFRRQRKACFLRFAAFLPELVQGDQPVVDEPDVGLRASMTHSADALEMVKDPAIRQEQIIAHLREMSREYEVSEVLEVIVRFDTPDVLG
jgi:hypothetical protein